MSTKGCKIVISIFKILTIIQICLSENDFRHKARINYKLKQDYVSEEISSKSVAVCLVHCSLQQDCISVSFRSPTEKCLFSSFNTIDDSADSPAIPRTLIFADGWTTMTRIIYPVFHALGLYEARYRMTFEQAKQQCIAYGTTIASPSELIQARSMGYGKCVCGWLSDGTIGYVMQKKVSGCGFSESITNLYCGSKANVYCKLK